MLAPKITWYVQQSDNSYSAETDYYAGTYLSGDTVDLTLQIWNNRWGTGDCSTMTNPVLNMTFDTVEDSALLPNIILTVNNTSIVSLLTRGRVASGVLETGLSGLRNNGVPADNAGNYITARIQISLTDGRFKANDLKNLYFDLTTLDGQVS